LNIFLRILLAIYSFCLAIISLVVIMAALRKDVFDLLSYYSETLLFNNGDMVPRLVVIGVALLFFIVSLVFLFLGVRANKDKKSVSKQTNIGAVCISLNSIESISLNAARKINGIRDTKVYITKKEDSVSVKAKLVVMPEIIIPSVSDEVQTAIKSAVEESAGVPVKDVMVFVDSVYDVVEPKPQKTEIVVKPRVE
jgi:uncharacterized alkaline shock family protein YloU